MASFCSEKVILRACVLILWIFFCMQTATNWNLYDAFDLSLTVADIKRVPEGSELLHIDFSSTNQSKSAKSSNGSSTSIHNHLQPGNQTTDNNTRFLYPWSSNLDEVRILQYDRYCSDQNVHRNSLVAGLYNTGTNALYQMLSRNCNRRGYMFLWQPEWGKHETFSPEKFHHWNSQNNKKENYYGNAVSIVIVKDPYTWIKSMCKANYDFRYIDRKWFKQCPHHMSKGNFNWIPVNRAKVMNRGPNRTSNGYFESPLGVWNAYYESWMIQMEQHISPTIFVRFEDLLFRPTETVTKICQCMGKNELLNKDGTVNIYEDKSKPHGKSNDRHSALRTYSDPMYRYTGFLPEDIEYVEQHVNRTLLELFAYHDRLGKGG